MRDKLAWIQAKIFDADVAVLARAVQGWRAAGDRVAFTNGCFDILHRGHLDYLARAAGLANRLIVGLNADASVKRLKGESRPVNNQHDRLFQMASLLVVDAVILFEEDTPLELITGLRPDVLAKGGDYTPETIVGAKEVERWGGEVAVIPFVDGYSTTGLIGKMRGG